MNLYHRILSYYILLVLGFVGTSWIIWARFLRERVIRDIPDGFFTEYRFWILFYISFIYFYTVKSYLKPKNAPRFFSELSERFYIPFVTLDHAIKYNLYFKSRYYSFMDKCVTYLTSCNRFMLDTMLYVFEVIPRIILVSFLLLDTFYFLKLELFYKTILVGLLPFIWRYSNYSLKDICDHWISLLEEKYEFIMVYEKGRKFQPSLLPETPKYHNKKVSVKEYIEIQFENRIDHGMDENFPYEYTEVVFAKDEVYDAYGSEKYKNTTTKLTTEDLDNIDRLFHVLLEKILELKLFLDDLKIIRHCNYIKWPKIIIFSLYFICWSFILIVSYWCYPVEFHMFKYFFDNLKEYLILMAEPFASLEQCSFNENLLTIENIKLLLRTIWNDISLRWKK